eukprot:654361-Lingulodinium_polyedra.AAC.1
MSRAASTRARLPRGSVVAAKLTANRTAPQRKRPGERVVTRAHRELHCNHSPARTIAPIQPLRPDACPA